MPGVRVLVLCAEIGEGHLTVARSLVGELRKRQDVAAVELCSDLRVMGRRFGDFMTRGFRVHLDQIGWSYELAYRLFFERSSPRRAAELALAALGNRGLRQAVRAFGADVVVAEFPVLSAALGVLRSLGRLAVPVCSSISDPAGLYYWAHPGIDLHLLSWPEAVAEVDRIAGPGRAAVVRPLIDQRFMTPPPRTGVRAGLGVPEGARVVLVSGGGWGLGDLGGATDVALASAPDAFVVALAGHNERARGQLLETFGGHPRVSVLGFSDRMPALLASADAVIHTTAGTTALESRVVGCPLVCYGSGVAHVRAHARALTARGLAEWAPDRLALGPALARALSRGRRPPLAVEQLPDAASLVAAVGRGDYRAPAYQRAAAANTSREGRAL